MRLFDINEKLEAAWNHIADTIENPDDFDEGHLEKMEGVLSEIEMSKEEKLINYARLIKNTKADAVAIKAEKDRMAAREKTLNNKIAWLTGAIKESVEVGEKIQDETCVIGTRKSQRVNVTQEDAELLPIDYQVVTYTANKTRIKKDLKAGMECTFAELVDDFSVSIK